MWYAIDRPLVDATATLNCRKIEWLFLSTPKERELKCTHPSKATTIINSNCWAPSSTTVLALRADEIVWRDARENENDLRMIWAVAHCKVYINERVREHIDNEWNTNAPTRINRFSVPTRLVKRALFTSLTYFFLLRIDVCCHWHRAQQIQWRKLTHDIAAVARHSHSTLSSTSSSWNLIRTKD